MQNKVPKIDAATLKPCKWPANPAKEWCPPGHGDLYPALAGTGMLDKLLADGVKYMFVSNSDNLGATLDLELLNYFAEVGFLWSPRVRPRPARLRPRLVTSASTDEQRARAGGKLGRQRLVEAPRAGALPCLPSAI